MSEETTQQFLQRLWELQAEAGLSNAALARVLGVSPSYIHHLRRGRPGRGRRIGLNVALAAASAFPELRIFLSTELPVGNTDVPTVNDQEHPQ